MVKDITFFRKKIIEINDMKDFTNMFPTNAIHIG